MAEKRREPLVSGFLEDVSVKVFDDHATEIAAVIGKKSGIYALYKNDRLYYVGLASNLFTRIRHHRDDKHRGKWNRFSAYAARRDRHIRELEALFLRISKPAGNLQAGKFARATNHKGDLNRLLNESAKVQRAQILGGKIAKKQRREVAATSKGPDALAALSGKRRKLWARRNGKDFQAILLQSGKIRFAGELYESPTAASRAADPKTRNGWAFWHYSVGKGEWVPLRNLR